ncbi:MAG: hypothetical protein GKC53_03650 [Neisseriaceae bacterium]|nr:MAG: hypothetical protein GKC53_03650 [Neisseriaceae bacterium]
MKKTTLFLLISTALLVSCKQSEENKNVGTTTTPTQVSETVVNGSTSVHQLNNQQIAVAQKEFLKVLSVKDDALTQIFQLGQSLNQNQLDEKSMKKMQDQVYRLSLETQKELNKLKITDQEIKNYIQAQNYLVELSEKLYKAQDKIEKEQKSGKLSEESGALLKQMQEAQGKVFQQELSLTDKLAQSGEQSAMRELLQIKSIQIKEAMQLASSMQILMNDSSSDEEKAKKMADVNRKIADDTVSELNKLSIQTEDIDDYRKKLLDLSKLKIKSIDRADKMQKEIAKDKKLSPESEQLMEQLQRDTVNVEKLRIQLTSKYAQ